MNRLSAYSGVNTVEIFFERVGTMNPVGSSWIPIGSMNPIESEIIFECSLCMALVRNMENHRRLVHNTAYLSGFDRCPERYSRMGSTHESPGFDRCALERGHELRGHYFVGESLER